MISVLIVIFTNPSLTWHQTLTYSQRSSYELSKIFLSCLINFQFSFILISFQSIVDKFVCQYEIFYVVSIVCDIWCSWTINFTSTSSKQIISKSIIVCGRNIPLKIFLSRWNFSLIIGRSMRWPWTNVYRNGILRFVSLVRSHPSFNANPSSLWFSRINVIMMSFMYAFYPINLPWMFIVPMLIDQWCESSTLKRCILLMMIFLYVIHIHRWILKVLMSC